MQILTDDDPLLDDGFTLSIRNCCFAAESKVPDHTPGSALLRGTPDIDDRL